MLKETARIAKVGSGAIWVAANQKSACGSCEAQKGCGQSALAEWAEQKSLLRIDVTESKNTPYHVDDEVVIGIPEDVVLGGTVLLYVIPLLGLIIGAVVGDSAFDTDLSTAFFAFTGLFLGGYLASQIGVHRSDPSQLHPVLLEHIPAVLVR